MALQGNYIALCIGPFVGIAHLSVRLHPASWGMHSSSAAPWAALCEGHCERSCEFEVQPQLKF